ncbi:hypothetical protein BO78DRAFT_459687 [Aspergillus sclerotiicarbonarius CBS 121057]|uniref:Glycine zipper 2TM domain-containing protein n=1 Tax=Aspergillus sclerotiicarbonarius (strain CBS 121057 / IBT 28362) TaxID=1448318 RepID=A0A319ELT7_ASPSB|nr:hypothetical protein BO78DRAFT_459687 [Aspergillus sclerotiicarbonarius CBS 121057]
MSEPYPQHPSYPPASGTGSEATTAYYSPPDGVYQHPPYDYDPQQFYSQHVPPNQDPAYSSQYDVSQIPRSYPAQWSQTSTTDAPPQQAYDADRLGPHYEPEVRRGSNAEYYNQPAAEQAQAQAPAPETTDQQDPDNTEGERSLGGAVLGGATGYYLGHKKDHGLLGAVGGALLGNFIGDKLKDRKENDDEEEVEVEDDDRETEYSYHSRRTRTSSSHGHGHGHHHHHHHHHHHGHHGHRSRSRHSGFEEEY